MKKLITLSKDTSIKVSSRITSYLEPGYVYLPILSTDYENFRKQKIKKGANLFSFRGKTVYSPVSGVIVGIKRLQEQDYLVIQNDFREEDQYIGVSNQTTVILKDNFAARIQKYADIHWELFQGKNELILNGIEDEPYIANKTFIHKYQTSEIFQMLDLLADYFHIAKVTICLKENDRESIEAIEEYLGTYPNFCLKILPDYYPLGNEEILKRYIHLTEFCVVVSTEMISDMYLNVIRERKKDRILITVTGDAIKNPQVVEVKIGTPLADIKRLFQFKETEYCIFLNGLMKPTLCDGEENLILTEEIRAIYFMRKKQVETRECIRCGKCVEICPMKCNPYYSFKTKGKYKNEKCLHCGLCTFICPSFIPLATYLGEEKNE